MDSSPAANNSIVYAIPKDPRTHHAVFLTGLPYVLRDLVSEEEWQSAIGGLNSIMMEKESPSLLNLLKMGLMFPILFESGSYDGKVRGYLDGINESLAPRGVFIKDPSLNSYIELEIVVTIK